MSSADAPPTENRAFEADVARLLQLMVHSVYSERDIFLRELISNAADACEKLRYEAIATPALLGEDPKARITIALDADGKTLTVEDNGIGMGRDEMVEALGTIARSGTRAFVERLQGGEASAGAQLIGQFGIGFYSAFMVAERVEVISRRAGSEEAWRWSSEGKGTFSVAPAEPAEAPARGTRVVLHLMEDAKDYLERATVERVVREQSGHVPVPIAIVEKPGAEPTEIADGAALWARPRSEVTAEDHKDFYRSVAGQFDEPALTVHYRAEGRHEYTVLLYVPSTRPFDLFEPERKGRIKLYVKRVFISDDVEILPRYLRFVRGLVDSADIPLNVSREMIQESPVLGAIRNAVTGRVLSELEKLAEKEPETYAKTWDAFGAVLKEGIYEDFGRRDQLMGLSRFHTTSDSKGWRSLKDYVGALKPNQTAIYYIVGDDIARLEASPHLEGFRARGIEVLLLTDQVDSFWVTSGASFDGKPFKSITQGAADLSAIPLLDAGDEAKAETTPAIESFVAFMKSTLGDAVAEVKVSDRLTDSAVCLVAPASGLDRQLEKLLASAGRLPEASKPVLEINPRNPLIAAIAALPDDKAELKQDVAHLLLDEARVLDGDRPADARAFADRLARTLTRALG
ncbi:MAG: molecular chaperone HtpG [Reyranellaceae bacterium]